MASLLLLIPIVLASGSKLQKPPAAVTPKVVTRPVQRYVAVRKQATLFQLSSVIPAAVKQVSDWMGAHGMKPASAPFTRYLVVDMQKSIDIEVGFPVSKPVKGSGDIHAGSFPAGRYARYVYSGNYMGLIGVNAQIQAWAQKTGTKLARKDVGKAVAWGGRAEYYLTDPAKEKDPNKQRAEIIYLLAK